MIIVDYEFVFLYVCCEYKLALHSKFDVAKGQVISKGFYGVFNFFQKTNENKSS